MQILLAKPKKRCQIEPSTRVSGHRKRETQRSLVRLHTPLYNQILMLRRSLVPLLLGALCNFESKASVKMDEMLAPGRGAAILLDIRSRRLIATNSQHVAGTTLTPPGSTLKPFVIASLLKRGKLRFDTSFPCPGHLTIANRRFDCTHPALAMPVRPDTALAYSCNCFVARVAERFDQGELTRDLRRYGFTSLTTATTLNAVRLQAIGEAGITVTPLELALAYRNLAMESVATEATEMQPVLAGLEGAVEFGTAQRARVAGVAVAGKTGSTRNSSGDFIAWFAGFLPGRAPETVVAVMLSGRSGGADAAPVAAQILEAYRGGLL
jgi:cell division protein FtsI/penicillin-binding protein 2